MDLNWIWESIIIFFVGTFILRIGGRKSISQMTIAQTAVMIGLGSLIIQPITGRGLTITLMAAFLLILLMVITEYLQVKIDCLENLFSGKAVVVIESGELNLKNMKRLRLSVDKLETRLRQAGISSIKDVKYATLEVSGQLGYELKDNKKPLIKEDFMTIMGEIEQLKNMINNNTNNQSKKDNINNIFEEINNKKFEGNKNEP